MCSFTYSIQHKQTHVYYVRELIEFVLNFNYELNIYIFTSIYMWRYMHTYIRDPSIKVLHKQNETKQLQQLCTEYTTNKVNQTWANPCYFNFPLVAVKYGGNIVWPVLRLKHIWQCGRFSHNWQCDRCFHKQLSTVCLV